MLKLVSLGANLGDAKSNLLEAANLIRSKLGSYEIRGSHLYDTPPVGGPQGQQRFFNAVLALDSPHSPLETWQLLREVEAQLGRHREVRWEARRIDLDLLLAADERLWTPQFKLPHPRMCMRTFILEPACEVAADWTDPVSGWTIQQLASQLAYPNHAIYVLYDSKETEGLWWEAMPEDWSRVEHEENRSEWRDGYRSVHWIPVQGPDLRTQNVAIVEHPHEARSLWGIPGTPRTKQGSKGKVSDGKGSDVSRWEDQATGWAEALGMASDKSDRPTIAFHGPRYLIPGTDAQWGVHELLAAFEAMRCEIRKLNIRCFD